MKTEFLKKFFKDIDKLKNSKDRNSVLEIIESVKAAESIEHIPGIKN
jgi:hypothetical protein